MLLRYQQLSWRGPIFGLIVVVLAIYGIIRAIWHLVIEIIEITAITLGSILAAVVLCRRRRARHSLALHQAKDHGPAEARQPRPGKPAGHRRVRSGKPAQDTAELFADAIANDMDPRFVERILNAALERHDR